MAKIRITDLLLRTIIGTNPWERKKKQDVIINVTIDYNSSKAQKSDMINDALDYKLITKKIIEEVERSQFFLLEKMASLVLSLVTEDKRVKEATVRIDKPNAIRFARSISVELVFKRS